MISKLIFYSLFGMATILTIGCENTGNEVRGKIAVEEERSTLQANDLSLSINEGSSATILLILDKPVSNDAVLNWQINAPAGVFDNNSGAIQFNKGTSSQMLQLQTVQNTERQGNFTYQVVLSGTEKVFANSLTLNLTVLDDESPPVISIANSTLTEGTGAGTANMSFTVSLNLESNTDVVVNYATADDSAVAPADYTSTSGTLTIPAGSLTGTILVPIVRDSTPEPTEKFFVNLSGGSGYTVTGSNLQAVGTITDDDPPAISISNSTIIEGTGAGYSQASITITAAMAFNSNITVNYETLTTGTATPSVDFTSTSGTATITAGSTSTSFIVPIRRDSMYEENETVDLKLSGGSNYDAANSQLTATLTIQDDDTAPTISIANASGTEGNGGGTNSMSFTVSLSEASGYDTTVNYSTADDSAISPDDYTSTSGTLTIPAGSTSGTILVPVVRDSVTELTEKFYVNLSGGSNYTASGSVLQATGTIYDDDPPSISISNFSVTEGTGAGTTNATVTITSDFAYTAPVTVNYQTLTTGTATSGTDFTAVSGTATIAAGSLTTSFNIPITRDSLHEADETIDVQLSGGSGYNSSASQLTSTVTITDDDLGPAISIANQSITEGTAAGTKNMVFTVSVNAISGLDVSFDYSTSDVTAVAGSDYTATSGSAQITAGNLSTTITVPIIQDSIYESTETFELTLSNVVGHNPTGSVLTATGSILDDDFINQVWNFSDPSKFTFDPSFVSFSGSKAVLKPLQTSYNDSASFNLGTHNGTRVSAGKLTIDTGFDSVKALNASWAPKWSNLRAYYQFDETAGSSTVSDLITGTTGTLGSGVILGGAAKVSTGVSFPGTLGANIPTGPGLSLTTQFTISTWVNTSDFTPYASILAYGDGVRAAYLYVDGSSFGISARWSDGTNVFFGAPAGLTANRWYHIAATYDGLTVRMFVDGSEVASRTAFGKTLLTASPAQLIFGKAATSSVRFIGSIDDTAVWDAALTNSDVKNIYLRQRQTYSNELSENWTPRWSNLGGYWKLDGSWADSSGNGFTATAYNSADVAGSAKIGSNSATFVRSSTSYARLGPALSIIPTGTNRATLAAWIRPTLNSSDQRVLTFGSGTVSRMALLIQRNSGTISAFCTTASDGLVQIDTPHPIAYNTWQHVAFVLGNNTGSLYIDGRLVATNTTCDSVRSTAFDTSYAALASDNSGLSTFQGNIDDVAVWRTNLSAGDIRMIYERQREKFGAMYESPIINAGTTVPWTSLSTQNDLPFMKEIPASGEESNATYPGIVNMSGVTGSGSNLSNLLLANYRFNETSGTSLTNSIGPATATASSAAMVGAIGLLNNGLSFTRSLNHRATTQYFELGGNITFAMWVNLRPINAGGQWHTLISNAGTSTSDGFKLAVNSWSSNDGKVHLETGNGSLGSGARTIAGAVEFNKWTHIAVTIHRPSGVAQIYVNGKAATMETTAVRTDFKNSSSLTIGAMPNPDAYMDGYMDELSIWRRRLNANEILELYRRGANRVKYQVRSCADVTCKCKTISNGGSVNDCSNDGTANDLVGQDAQQATWIGPDGTNATYFSELQNAASVDSSGVATGAVSTAGNLSLDWTTSFFPAAARPANNTAFQYRAYLESFDSGSACSGATCLPTVTSIQAGPTGRYYGGRPALALNDGITYSQAKNLSKSDKDSCVRFQVRTAAGGSWQYLNGAALTNASLGNKNHMNFITDFEGKLPATGTLSFRAILVTNDGTGEDLTQSCELNSFGVEYRP